MECPICNQSCVNRRILSLHMAKHHKNLPLIEREYIICNLLFGVEVVQELITQYKDEVICCDDLVRNKTDIVKLLKLLGLKRTNQQEKLTKRYREKYSSTIIERYGVDNVSKSEDIKKKKLNTMVETTGHNDYSSFFKSVKEQRESALRTHLADVEQLRQRYETMKVTLKERYGVSNAGQIGFVRKLNAEKQKLFFQFMSDDDKRLFTLPARSTFIRGHNWCSQIEQRIHLALEKAEIPFKKHVFINGYNFDILIGKNLLIEINGDFWHANPRIYIESDIVIGDKRASDIWAKDLRKRMSISSEYNLLVYWEMDINSMSDEDVYNMLIEDIYNVEFGNNQDKTDCASDEENK